MCCTWRKALIPTLLFSDLSMLFVLQRYKVSVYRRYSDFDVFHEVLLQRFAYRVVPAMPPKRMLKGGELLRHLNMLHVFISAFPTSYRYYFGRFMLNWKLSCKYPGACGRWVCFWFINNKHWVLVETTIPAGSVVSNTVSPIHQNYGLKETTDA